MPNTNTVAAQKSKAPSTTLGSHALQRKCACGNHTSGGGECANCAANKLQKKLSVGAANDPLEFEADRVADQVLANSPTHSFSDVSTPKIQRRAEQSPSQTEEIPTSVERVLSSSGNPLPQTVRSDMEQRFNQDFSQVRIHTGGIAALSARDVNANAYTAGNNIVFGSGKFSPESQQGKHLLAHELTHVVQQQRSAPSIQRQPAKNAQPGPADEATKLEQKILVDPVYLKLKADSKANVVWIIAQAKTKPVGDAKGQRNYYLKKLQIAITTPFNGKESGKKEYGCSEDAEKRNRDAVSKALKLEARWGGAFSDLDEDRVAAGKSITKRTGQGGKTFTVDRSNPRNILVKIKVKLNGKPDDTSKIKQLEDAIERAVSIDTKGYFIDIEFVDTKGTDVFEFTVNFCEWANSGNWASSPVTISHEVHHALGLGDRYDYIESHAPNPQMNVPMRLHWFVEQMKKTGGPRDPFSKMHTSSKPLLAEDACAVAFDAGPERDKCIAARKDLDPVGVPPI